MQLFSSSSVPNSTPLDGDTSVGPSFSFVGMRVEPSFSFADTSVEPSFADKIVEPSFACSTAESLSLTLSKPVSPSELSSLSLLWSDSPTRE